MASIGVTILSFKEKALIHERGLNFYPIDTKLDTYVSFIKIQIKFVDELFGAIRSGNTFLQRKYNNPL